jgi:hypothetical protein
LSTATTYIPVDPSLAATSGTQFDVCFAGGFCEPYKAGWQMEPSNSGTVTRILKGPSALERVSGGSLANPELIQATDGYTMDIFMGSGSTPQVGGVSALWSNASTLIISGFSEPAQPNALFLKFVRMGTALTWMGDSISIPQAIWGAGGFVDSSGSTLTGAVMYHCPENAAQPAAAIFTKGF